MWVQSMFDVVKWRKFGKRAVIIFLFQLHAKIHKRSVKAKLQLFSGWVSKTEHWSSILCVFLSLYVVSQLTCIARTLPGGFRMQEMMKKLKKKSIFVLFTIYFDLNKGCFLRYSWFHTLGKESDENGWPVASSEPRTHSPVPPHSHVACQTYAFAGTPLCAHTLTLSSFPLTLSAHTDLRHMEQFIWQCVCVFLFFFPCLLGKVFFRNTREERKGNSLLSFFFFCPRLYQPWRAHINSHAHTRHGLTL